MPPTLPRPHGLRLTLRHQMILVAHCALLFTVVRSVPSQSAPGELPDWASWGLLLTPWLLSLLVMVLDRPGPMRAWAASLVMMLFSPALAIHHDLIVTSRWMATGEVPNGMMTFLVNLFFIGSFAAFCTRMAPVACPSCARRSLIPLMRLVGQTKRTSRTRWCASCGALYWRRGRGPWQKERRATWLDPSWINPLASVGSVTAPACPCAHGGDAQDAQGPRARPAGHASAGDGIPHPHLSCEPIHAEAREPITV